MNAAAVHRQAIGSVFKIAHSHRDFITCAFFMSARYDRLEEIAREHFAAFTDISKKSHFRTCAEGSNGLTVLSHTALVFAFGRSFFLGSFVFGFEGEKLPDVATMNHSLPKLRPGPEISQINARPAVFA